MKTLAIPFTKAKANLSRYAVLAEEGKTTLVLKHNRSSFIIAPVPQVCKARVKTPGLVHGQIHMDADFDATPDEVLRDFEGVS